MTKCLVDDSKLYDTAGRLATNAIFWETNNAKTRDKYPPSYTLKLRDYQPKGIDSVLPSAYNIYMDAIDEYDAAIKLVGNMANWETLCNLKWFMEGGVQPAVTHLGLKTWREHKAAKLKSEAMQVLKDKMYDEKAATTAAKAILAELKGESPKKKAGRPNKQENGKIDNIAKDFLKRVK